MIIRRQIVRLPAIGFLLTALLLMGGFLAGGGCAEDQAQQPPADDPPTEDIADPLASGKASYEAYCMSCHGPDGKGSGELAGELDVLPADLTQLAKNNGGTFPVDAVYQTIDGRKDVEAHGTRDMPVWGNIWSEQEGQPIPPEVVERRINELVEFLRTIQE